MWPANCRLATSLKILDAQPELNIINLRRSPVKILFTNKLSASSLQPSTGILYTYAGSQKLVK